MRVRGRRAFLLECATATGVLAASRLAHAYGHDGDLGHPVDPPPSLDFVKMSFPTSALKQPSTAIVGVPRGLAPGEKLPLVVLLPGGHSNWQPHDAGCWCWWSEYDLGSCDVALRRGSLTPDDFQGWITDDELAQFNRSLATTRYRGVIIAAAWCLTRDYSLATNGALNAAWLRELVTRIRAELPVIPTREATGLGGMSSGGMWSIYCGALCEDVFAMVDAQQPYTRLLRTQIREVVRARKTSQRLRIVTATNDRLRIPTLELCDMLHEDGVPFELHEYPGEHNQRYAAGPGGIDTLFQFDRALRGETPDGVRPLVAKDGVSFPISIPSDPPRIDRPIDPPPPPRWKDGAIAVGSVASAMGAALVAHRARAKDR